MSLLPRDSQNLLHSRFSCILIPFLMFSLDYDEGKVKYSPQYGRESKVTILVSRHFQSRMLPMERASKKRCWSTFLLEIGDLTKNALFWLAYPTPLRGSSMRGLLRES